MKYIQIWDIQTFLVWKGNEPGKLVEKSTIDINKLKKIDITYGESKHLSLLALFDNKDIYIIGKPQAEKPQLNARGSRELLDLRCSQAYYNKYKGIQLELSGRLRGAQRARKMVKKIGSLNQQSFSSNLRFSKRNIYTK